ncbi:hypothetical protein GA0116948_1464 [Chitinophaga costaii]|uniref:Uncharacterized protein n=1 Tax=Chitinophaga costaii TaxID=1335309 RepID=A0A1C4GAI0_9BACT|nr:hypothetical protein GA0116948_1464 [Chitinophaga costaii]
MIPSIMVKNYKAFGRCKIAINLQYKNIDNIISYNSFFSYFFLPIARNKKYTRNY